MILSPVKKNIYACAVDRAEGAEELRTLEGLGRTYAMSGYVDDFEHHIYKEEPGSRVE